MSFYPSTSQDGYATTGSLGRMGTINQLTDFYAAVDLPAGVIIDYVGLNSTTDTAFALGVALYNRTKDGNLTTLTTFSSTVHGWDTEFNADPIGYLFYGLTGNALILHVQLADVPTLQAFGWVEVWWRRVVSPPPPVALTMNDPICTWLPADSPDPAKSTITPSPGMQGQGGGANDVEQVNPAPLCWHVPFVVLTMRVTFRVGAGRNVNEVISTSPMFATASS